MLYDIPERARLVLRDIYYGGRSIVRLSDKAASKPVVLCNSYPKSGTHLLSQVLQRFASFHLWDDIIAVQSLSGVMNSQKHISWKYHSAPAGSIIRGHLMHCREVLDVISQRNTLRLMMYRDLRDVAVSHANWVLKEPRFYLHKYYKGLPNFESCLMASIVGVPLGSPFGSNQSHPDIGSDFARWSGWISDTNTLAIKFEDIVGVRGGGTEGRRMECIQRIAAALGDVRSPNELSNDFGSEVMNPEASHTFRKGNKGAIGTWRNHFNERHKDAFKRCAGAALVELGYENDDNW